MLAAIIKLLIFSIFDVNNWNGYTKTKFPDRYAIFVLVLSKDTGKTSAWSIERLLTELKSSVGVDGV